MLLAGMPRVTAGENVLLFLTEEAGSGIRMPVGLAQGKFSVVVESSGRKSLVRNGACIGPLGPESGSLGHGQSVGILQYAAVVAEIEAALASGR